MPGPIRFSETLYKYLDRAEILILIFIIAGVISHFLDITYADQLLSISFNVLGVVFFLNAFRPPVAPAGDSDGQSGFLTRLTQTILPKVLWVGCATGAMALSKSVRQLHRYIEQSKIFLYIMAAGLLVFGFAAATGGNVQPLTPTLYRGIPLALAVGHYVSYY